MVGSNKSLFDIKNSEIDSMKKKDLFRGSWISNTPDLRFLTVFHFSNEAIKCIVTQFHINAFLDK